ncbi:nuclease domain-containing protein [Zymobacter palmae]|uniref:Cytochrome c5 n=1 Tax=Zymobacter palmae TaxID=33074 RepID=A0A348HED7_9GAMM|nr:nuclease domain-containing protein [Zymobacter palmae]BBG29989.1 cytochrome c5 [Zymobacter palmae]
MRITSKAMRASARDERCTLGILGVCNERTDTTVLCHLPNESHGLARKSDDLSACYGCAACHDVIDGRVPWPSEEKAHAEWYMRRAQIRTLVRMVEKGIITIKGVAA